MTTGLNRESDWSVVRVCVAGIGIAGFAAADALCQLGAQVTVVDGSDGAKQRERAEILDVIGATVILGNGDDLPEGTDVLVVSPGLRPTAPIIMAARSRGVPVWGELELAWRLRTATGAADWLLITGTNGKTTTTLMAESMLKAAGLRATSAGNIGNSLIDVVMHDELDVIAVEVGAPQLPFVQSISPVAAACLNLAEDHVDHFGTFDEYRRVKALVFERTQVAAIYNIDDVQTRTMVEEADVVEGCRAIGFSLGVPARSDFGVVEDLLIDRAFSDVPGEATELALVSDVHPAAPHNVANALAAAALVRAYGIPAKAVKKGLIDFEPAKHRIANVATIDGVLYVDDSKATNAHAAQMSLLAYGQVVWIAGGMAKGQSFDDLVIKVRGKLRGVVALGVDRQEIIDALARHAPDVPIVEVDRKDTGAMQQIVREAAALAQPGDTVLLAPGCASWDMFRDYGHRGDEFAAAVRELGGAE